MIARSHEPKKSRGHLHSTAVDRADLEGLLAEGCGIGASHGPPAEQPPGDDPFAEDGELLVPRVGPDPLEQDPHSARFTLDHLNEVTIRLGQAAGDPVPLLLINEDRKMAFRPETSS